MYIKIKIKVERNESWYPEITIPKEKYHHLSDDLLKEYIEENHAEQIYDEYLHKYSYEQESWFELLDYSDPKNRKDMESQNDS